MAAYGAAGKGGNVDGVGADASAGAAVRMLGLVLGLEAHEGGLDLFYLARERAELGCGAQDQGMIVQLAPAEQQLEDAHGAEMGSAAAQGMGQIAHLARIAPRRGAGELVEDGTHIDHEEHRIGLSHCLLGLLGHFAVNTAGRVWFEPAGVDERDDGPNQRGIIRRGRCG